MTPEHFNSIREKVAAAGYALDVEWAENVSAPLTATDFATEAIFVICNSGMKHTVAEKIYRRVMRALDAGNSARTAFGHVGKADAIDYIWENKRDLFTAFRKSNDHLEFCGSLPWIGKITKYHLAKNFGIDVAKPDVHLQRLADHYGTTPQLLCEKLADETGLRVNTVDVVLWRACAIGVLNDRAL